MDNFLKSPKGQIFLETSLWILIIFMISISLLQEIEKEYYRYKQELMHHSGQTGRLKP